MVKKDLIELCLLHLLSDEDLYGYELLRRIHESFPDTQESGIYAILRGLKKAGCTEHYAGTDSGGPPRKYYRLTPAGAARRDALRAEWTRLRDAVSALGIG